MVCEPGSVLFSDRRNGFGLRVLCLRGRESRTVLYCIVFGGGGGDGGGRSCRVRLWTCGAGIRCVHASEQAMYRVLYLRRYH